MQSGVDGMSFESCYRAVEMKDGRFDGRFFTAVASTGIYCRPSCPARTPQRRNVRFYVTAAAAQAAGFRACKRCRPDASPGSPAWDAKGDVVARAMRLIADGTVDRGGVSGLAERLGFSERHLHRVLVGELGVGPQALARAHRAQTARVLLETTALGMNELALSAGFASVRQFNSTMREIYALTPSELRARARGRKQSGAGGGPRSRSGSEPGLTVRLPVRTPFDGAALIAFLGARAVPGVEEPRDGSYRRSMRLPRAAGVVELTPATGHVQATLWLEDLRDLGPAINRCRRLLDLDSDPLAVLDRLGSDELIGPLVRARPGLRVPGAVDEFELAVRALLGQQVSVAAARTLAGRLVTGHGARLARPIGGITHLFPSAEALAELDPARAGMPRARARAVIALARAAAAGELALHVGADRAQVTRTLLRVPGIGPWTAGYIAMRALRDPDGFATGDLGVRRGLMQLGCALDASGIAELAERWRPYRAYALMHIWQSERQTSRGAPTAGAPTAGAPVPDLIAA